MKHYVYLAGPITGLTYEGCTDWRDKVAEQLNNESVRCLSPLRGKQFLSGKGAIHSGSYDDNVISSKGITRRDMFDTLRSTAIFVNLLGAERVSIGTCMEIAWAYQNQIPSIVLMEKDNVHRKHVMIQEASMYIADSLEEGIKLMKFLLNDCDDLGGSLV